MHNIREGHVSQILSLLHKGGVITVITKHYHLHKQNMSV